MAVVRCEESSDAAVLIAMRGGRREWECPYRLLVNNPSDDGQVIVDYFDTLGRGLSSGLIYGDREDMTVICKRIHPIRDPKSRLHWTAVLSYSPLDDTDTQNEQDENGDPTDDPLDFRYDITSSTQYFQVPVEKAWNMDIMPKDGTAPGYTRGLELLGPVHNSAGVVYDPPPIADVAETVLRISGNLSTYNINWLRRKVNRINQFSLSWHETLRTKYDFEMTAIEPYCVLCSAATADYRRENGRSFWRYTYEFRIRDRASATNPQDGFLESILDRGVSRIANAGAPDGAGGTISASDIEVGMGVNTPIRDWQGERVPELVLLDGHGRPLQGSSTLSAPPVYFRWRIHAYGEFACPGIPLEVFDP